MDGFMAAAFVSMSIHQIKLMLGVPVKVRVGIFKMVYLIMDMFKSISKANVASVIIGIVSLCILIFVKYFINKRFRVKLPVPIPIDLFVMIASTLASHYGKFEERFGLDIVGVIPKGVPRPTLPSPKLMQGNVPDAFAVAILSYLHVYMMATLFGKRHNYPSDPNQELFACGMANSFGGFFACIGASSSPPRCFVMEATGGKSQVAYFISGVVVLLFMFFLAPLLEALPISILASIIFSASFPLLNQCCMCVTYWKTNKYDFAIWFVTAVSTFLITIETGMAVGIIFSCFTTVFKSQKPYSTTLVASHHGILVATAKYASFNNNNHGLEIFCFNGPVYFATVDIFRSELFKATVSPSEIKSINTSASFGNGNEGQELMTVLHTDLEDPSDCNWLDHEASNDDHKLSESEGYDKGNPPTPLTFVGKENQGNATKSKIAHAIIIDCCRIPFIDTVGAKCFSTLRADYDQFGVSLLLAGCTEDVRAQFMRMPQCEGLVASSLYPSVYDAIAACKRDRHLRV